MQSPRLLLALKLSVLLLLLTAAHAWPMVGPPSAALAAEVTTSALTETLAAPSANGAGPGATPTPEAELFLEGTIHAEGFYECPVLETDSEEYFLLFGDLQGFDVGNRVGVWANLCPECISICSGTIVTVKGIVGLGGVGGIAELPEAAGAPLEAGASSGPSAGVLAGIVAAAAMGAVALGGAAWYVRRRA